MKTSNLREKNIEELKIELLNLFREKLSLNIQAANGRLQQTHILKETRRKIARVKTLLTEKGHTYNE